jgi:A/G-specific adenine glycosylase
MAKKQQIRKGEDGRGDARAGNAARRRLLAWFDEHQRRLPWRDTRDPWAILVSEIMLQQTTVTAALPYYERFVRRWPRPADLARARQDELLAAWAGLGYYRRARNLQHAASVVAENGGRLPGSASELSGLPGVGEYTAAAVASIAFGEAVVAIDGNVERVLSRYGAIDGNPKLAGPRRAIRALAESLIDKARPGDFNQALMELGATLCRPTGARCARCPLASGCRARALDRVARYPAKPARPEPVAVLAAAVVLRRGKRVLLRRRKEAPNAGFLELPGIRVRPGTGTGALRSRLERELSERHGLVLRLSEALPECRNSITRYRITTVPFVGTLDAGRLRAPLTWSGADDERPLTTASRRILARAHPDLYTARPGATTDA